MSLSKEAYEKFGIEGKRVKECDEYQISLDLLSPKLLVGQEFRNRLLQHGAELFNIPLQWQLSCSQMAWQRLMPLLQGHKWNTCDVTMTQEQLSFSPPPNVNYFENQNIPTSESLEDLLLWMGSITCGLLRKDKVDPFISTCTLPSSDTSVTQCVHHYTLESEIPMPCSKISELIESIPLKSTVFISGNDGWAQQGFLMRLDQSQDFLFCSSIMNS